MSRIRSRDTTPEWILRCGLHRMGFRYTLGNGKLPGKPDLVFPKYRAAIFVHGCFWHRHADCKRATFPKSNTERWSEKFRKNVARDRSNLRELRGLGWRTKVVWECELLDDTIETVAGVADWLQGGRRGDIGRRPGLYDSSQDQTEERRSLLRVAEGKVKRRLSSYDGED